MGNEERISSALLREYLLKSARDGKRRDGRAFDQFRAIDVKTGVYTKGEGEAWVSLGETQVLVSVKVDVGEPFPDTPDKGVLISNVELPPLASPSFEPGRPGENAVEMARVVDRAFRGSDAIGLSELVIKEGELVYLVFLDMYVLDYDGNPFDAFTLASLIALAKAELPKVKMGPDGKPELVEGKKFPLPLHDHPLSFSFVKIGGHLMLDPDLQEEVASDALLTLALDKDRNVCSIQKRKGCFTVDEINKALEVARSKYPDIMKGPVKQVVQGAKGRGSKGKD